MRRLLALLAPLALVACKPGAHHDQDPQRCATCHMDEFRRASHPVHVGARPTTCAVCHAQDAWRPSILDHPWPLTGGHAKLACFDCHRGHPPKFRGTAKECVGCHRPDYDRAPGHVARKFPTRCEQCHRTTAWSDRADDATAPRRVPPAPPPAQPTAKPKASAPTAKPSAPPAPDATTRASPKW